MNEKERIVKGGYLSEVVSHEGKSVIWEVLNDHVVEEATDHDDIGLWVFDFNFLTYTRRR